MNANSGTIRRRYDRVARIYDALDAPMERAFAAERRRLAGCCHGAVLEVGTGTGRNLPHYPTDATVTAIDFSPRMLDRARRRLAQLPRRNVILREMDVEALDFPDDSFDCALATCVFCSVPDPVQGLREIRRVVRPGGTIYLLEHVRSERPALGRLMDLLNPIPVHLYGANINRRTVDNLRAAGFDRLEVTDLWLDVLKRIVIHNAKPLPAEHGRSARNDQSRTGGSEQAPAARTTAPTAQNREEDVR